MKTKSSILILIATAIVFLTSCISRENFFELSNDMLEADINLMLPGGGSILDFGQVPRFSLEEIPVTVENNGDYKLVISSVTKGGDFPDQFTLDVTSMSSVVGVGESTTFKVGFQPESEGDSYATITIRSNDPDDGTYDIALYGVGTASSNTGPEISVSFKELPILDLIGSVDFGNVETNESSLPARFTIKNIGDSPLTISDINLNSTGQEDFTLADSETSRIIEAGGSTTFDIIFNPQSHGPKTSTLTIESNAYDLSRQTYTFIVTGTGSPTAVADINVALKNDSIDLLSISGHEAFDFGTVWYSYANPKSNRFVILNAGTAPLEVNVSLISPIGFSIDISSISSPLAAGEETYFELTLDSGAIGPVSTSIEIDTNGTDPDEDPYIFDVTGTRSAIQVPDISLIQSDLDYDVIPGGSGVYDFGDVDLSSPPETIEFTVKNIGGDNLMVGQPVSGNPDEFTVSAGSITSPIIPSSSQTFEITFNTADQVGEKSSVITISNDDPDFTEDFFFTVKGTVINIFEPEMDVYQGAKYYVRPNMTYKDFDDIIVNEVSDPVTFTIYNFGDAELVIGQILFTTGDNEDFFIDLNLTNFNVPVGESTTFDVYFAPKSTGTQKAGLTISSNDSSEGNFKIRFEGTGI
jgi:hypothetical protein